MITKNTVLHIALIASFGQSSVAAARNAEFATISGRGELPSCEHTANEFRCVTYVKNYDGDTITVSIPSVHPLIGESIAVRVKGVDTPEIGSKSSCESQVAKAARDFVSEKLRSGQRVDLVDLGRDKYFRILADVQIDHQSLAAELIEKGYAYPYQGGTKGSPDWCLALQQLAKTH